MPSPPPPPTSPPRNSPARQTIRDTADRPGRPGRPAPTKQEGEASAASYRYRTFLCQPTGGQYEERRTKDEGRRTKDEGR
ncbi:MAG: hypothetical protein M1815_003234 [Lichina confinis]|nr:MAG: hypothetical protein M1815_003234 [Lichina confinis]